MLLGPIVRLPPVIVFDFGMRGFGLVAPEFVVVLVPVGESRFGSGDVLLLVVTALTGRELV